MPVGFDPICTRGKARSCAPGVCFLSRSRANWTSAAVRVNPVVRGSTVQMPRYCGLGHNSSARAVDRDRSDIRCLCHPHHSYGQAAAVATVGRSSIHCAAQLPDTDDVFVGQAMSPQCLRQEWQPLHSVEFVYAVEDFLLCQIGRVEHLIDLLHAHEALAGSRYGKDRIACAAF